MKVTLDRSQGGLGISITGGVDNQIRRDDSNIYITKVKLRRFIYNFDRNVDERMKCLPVFQLILTLMLTE